MSSKTQPPSTLRVIQATTATPAGAGVSSPQTLPSFAPELTCAIAALIRDSATLIKLLGEYEQIKVLMAKGMMSNDSAAAHIELIEKMRRTIPNNAQALRPDSKVF